jgi:hypothetical protein
VWGAGLSSRRHSRRVIRPTWHTGTNFIFYREFAVHNILHYYFGTGEDDKKPGSIPGDTRKLLEESSPGYYSIVYSKAAE